MAIQKDGVSHPSADAETVQVQTIPLTLLSARKQNVIIAKIATVQ